MRIRFFTLAVAALALLQAGCAAGFRAGGDHGGVGAGAAIGHPPATYVQP